MIRLLFAITALILADSAHAQSPGDFQKQSHQVVYDDRTYQRDSDDQRCCVWTDDPEIAFKMLEPFALTMDIEFVKGEVLAIFYNDRITEDLTQIDYNKVSGEVLAVYKDSGIRFKMAAPDPGRKYSHLTIVVFILPNPPSKIGIQGQAPPALSEKAK